MYAPAASLRQQLLLLLMLLLPRGAPMEGADSRSSSSSDADGDGLDQLVANFFGASPALSSWIEVSPLPEDLAASLPPRDSGVWTPVLPEQQQQEEQQEGRQQEGEAAARGADGWADLSLFAYDIMGRSRGFLLGRANAEEAVLDGISIKGKKNAQQIERLLLMKWLESVRQRGIPEVTSITSLEDVESIGRLHSLGFHPESVGVYKQQKEGDEELPIHRSCIRWSLPASYVNERLTYELERGPLIRDMLLPQLKHQLEEKGSWLTCISSMLQIILLNEAQITVKIHEETLKQQGRCRARSRISTSVPEVEVVRLTREDAQLQQQTHVFLENNIDQLDAFVIEMLPSSWQTFVVRTTDDAPRVVGVAASRVNEFRVMDVPWLYIESHLEGYGTMLLVEAIQKEALEAGVDGLSLLLPASAVPGWHACMSCGFDVLSAKAGGRFLELQFDPKQAPYKPDYTHAKEVEKFGQFFFFFVFFVSFLLLLSSSSSPSSFSFLLVSSSFSFLLPSCSFFSFLLIRLLSPFFFVLLLHAEYKLATLHARLSGTSSEVHTLTTAEEFGAFLDPSARHFRSPSAKTERPSSVAAKEKKQKQGRDVATDIAYGVLLAHLLFSLGWCLHSKRAERRRRQMWGLHAAGGPRGAADGVPHNLLLRKWEFEPPPQKGEDEHSTELEEFALSPNLDSTVQVSVAEP
ncbi:hypothetical protein Efla_000085 [Eimeria flavescens]